MAGEQLPGPRAVRRIACGYDLSALPAWWLMVHRRIKTAVERQGLRVKVDLAPLSALPPEVDLVIVPPELASTARERAPQAECVSIGSQQYPGAVIELLSRLGDEQRYQVERVERSTDLAGRNPKV